MGCTVSLTLINALKYPETFHSNFLIYDLIFQQGVLKNAKWLLKREETAGSMESKATNAQTTALVAGSPAICLVSLGVTNQKVCVCFVYW